MNIKWQRIKIAKLKLEKSRGELSAIANGILSGSKKLIFILQRGDLKVAESARKELAAKIQKAKTMVKKQSELAAMGVWRAAQEEYAEAILFGDFVIKGRIISLDILDDPDIVLGGLSDAAGEIARWSVLKAVERDAKAVKSAFEAVGDIVEFLAVMDLTGSLRNKYDQARQHLRRAEDVYYQMNNK